MNRALNVPHQFVDLLWDNCWPAPAWPMTRTGSLTKNGAATASFGNLAGNRGPVSNLLHLSASALTDPDAARDFAGVMAHVRLGAEVVIENETRAVAVVRPAVPTGPGRPLSEIIAAADSRGSSALLDGDFARDLEVVINSHPEPLDPPAWD